jgi:hypothetical protein
MSEKIPDAVRAYMSEIGSKKTKKKTQTSRENAMKATAARRKNPMDLPCVCTGGDSLEPMAHKTTCPRGRLLRQRARIAAPPSPGRVGRPNSAGQMYTQSFAQSGELTAFSDAQEDLHEYSADELALMESGAFAGPLQ